MIRTPPFTDHDVERIVRIHEDVKRFLLREHPRAPSMAIVIALSYEIGRLAGQLTVHTHLSNAEADAMLVAVAEIMRQHVQAYRLGLTE